MNKQGFKRTDRVSATLKKELAKILHTDFSDPRLSSFVTITELTVSRDLAHAKVYFTIFSEQPKHAEMVLNEASGFIRSLLVKRVNLRIMPQLRFIFDESIEYGSRLSQIIEDVAPTDDEPK